MPPSDLDPASADYARRHGALCAAVRWTPGQIACGLVAVAALAAGLALAPRPTWVALSTCIALLSAATLGLRLFGMAVAAVRDPALRVDNAELAAADRDGLPRYSVLVPLYREPEVVPQLIAALSALDYPCHLLDIQFLIEPDDEATAAALNAHALPPYARITVAPPGLPRTKPRACNAGLALASGELLVIFDAEDRPEPDQLLKAALAFRRLGPETVCLQARLDHYNSRQSLPTRWTTIDYLLWYRLVLPGLAQLRAPLPLGGTSNHFRIAALRELGGWDPFNVTEDCDLGMRIARRGWRTGLLASTTWEEAVAGARGWVNQRSRWLKGYLQTFLVHSRAPFAFSAWGGLLAALTTAGLVAALLLNPLAWLTVLAWLALGWSVVDTASVLSIATLAVTAGLLVANLLVVVLAAAVCLRFGRADLLGAAIITPAAWVLQSVAAWKAAHEYVVRPFHWRKTRHGQAVHDADGLRLWHGFAAAALALAAAGAALALAGQRIGADVARQEEDRRPRPEPPPVQLALRFVQGEHAATGLVSANNPNRPRPWQAVEIANAPACGSPQPIPALRATADFPTQPLALTSRSMRDLSEAAALACDVLVAPDAPNHVRLAVHWRDEDGRWFTHLAEQRAIPGTWTRFEFPLHEAAAWQAQGHTRPWHRDLLRRVGELGLTFFAHQAYEGELTVANLRTIAAAPPPLPAPACTVLRPGAEAVAVLERWRLDVDLGRSFANPYDPAEVALDGEFTTPDGRSERVPAFYFQDYARRLVDGREELEAVGEPCWRLAYRARQPGAHRWRLLLAERGGEAREVAAGAFTATPAAHPGYIRRSAAKPEYLARDDGSFYWPIGHNLCHAVDQRPPTRYSFPTPTDQGSFTYDRYFAGMAGNGMNMARIWMTPWGFGVEGSPQWRHYYGLGRYSQAAAWRLDRLFDEGERLGIDLLLTITHMSELQTAWGSEAWYDSALNQTHGGPLRQPEEFYRSRAVIDQYKRRLRYLVARWGDRPNLVAWEFFGEANLVPGFERDRKACARWHEELARFVRPLDLDRHLIWTHTHNWQEGHDLWRLPEIGCVQGNGYIRPPNHSTNHVLNFDNYLREVQQYRKPVLVAEYGGRSELGAPSEDYLRGQLHSGLWASVVRPFAGLALHWWWNFTDGADLYRHYRGPARFCAGLDRVARDYRAVKPSVVASGAHLLAAGMQDDDSGFYWVHHPDIFENWKDVPTVAGATLRLTGLAPGTYAVEFWDTLEGTVSATRQVQNPGALAIELPPVPRDLALKVRRVP